MISITVECTCTLIVVVYLLHASWRGGGWCSITYSMRSAQMDSKYTTNPEATEFLCFYFAEGTVWWFKFEVKCGKTFVRIEHEVIVFWPCV